jgi:hypothetical protein
MILNNYYEYIKIFGNRGSYFSNGTLSNVKRMSDGANIFVYTYDGKSIVGSYSNSMLNSWIGSGTTEVTKTDWDLANDETSNFSDIVRNYKWRSIIQDGKAKGHLDYKFSAKNNTDSPITITEFGISKHFSNNSQVDTYMGKQYGTLFIRELLPEPVTVLPYQVINLSLCWIF